MRIFTHVTFHWRYGWLSATEEAYDGPMGLAGGGGTEVVNETVPTGPWGPQIPYINQLFQQANQLYGQGAPLAYGTEDGAPLTADVNPNLQNTQDAVGGLAGGNIDQNQAIQQFLMQLGGGANPGQTFGQGLTPGIEGGINEQLGAGSNPLAQFLQSQLGGAGGAYSEIFGQGAPGQYDPGQTQGQTADASGAINTLLQGGGGQNPYLDQLVQGAVSSAGESFNRNVLPGIRTEAQQAGQIGGTRHGIAEGIAGGDLVNQIGDITSNIYGNAFNTQAGLQGQAMSDILRSQGQGQAAGIQAAGVNNQAYQQYINSLLQGSGQVQSGLGQGLGLGYDAIGTGTAQAGNLFGQGNSLQLQQQLQSLGLIPGFQAGSMSQLGAVNSMGLQQYGLDQAGIDALMQQYYFNQNSPFNLLSQYQQYVTGPYGSTVGNTYGYGLPPGYPNVPGRHPIGQAPAPTTGLAPPQQALPPPPAPEPLQDPQQPPNPLPGGTT